MEKACSYSFIINPIAGGKKKTSVEKMVHEVFNQKGRQVSFYNTQYPTHAYEFAKKEVEKGTNIIVAVGGDGTINEVARALINTEAALGIIPLGSGNGFARHFNFPLNSRKALNILLTKNIHKVDVGMLNDRPFFCTSGLGFDAETGYRFNQYSARGFLSYALSFFNVFKNYTAKDYKLIIDDKEYYFSAFFINIANISQYGYHFYISPQASAKDGLLDFVVVKSFPKILGVLLAFKSFFGTIHQSKYVYIHRSRVIKILEPSGEKVVHIDGDSEIISNEITFSIQPSCLNLILPDGAKK